MMMMMTFIIIIVVVVVAELMNVQRVLKMRSVAWSLQCCSQKEGKQETG
jgi:hypothetical protein